MTVLMLCIRTMQEISLLRAHFILFYFQTVIPTNIETRGRSVDEGTERF